MDERVYELYRAYYEDLYRFVRQVVAGRGDVDALVQEVLLAANRQFPQYRGEFGYKAWLFAVANQHLNSPWRNLLRGRKGQTEEIAEVLPADLEEDERERQHLLRELELLFAELPRLEREVLVLRDLHEFSVRDAGLIVQVMDEKVRVLTERALDKVKGRFPQPDQYQRAVRLMRDVPDEPELRRKKAAMWEAFASGAKQVRRRSKLRPVIWGAVGVVVTVAVVFGWRQVQGGQVADQATTAPAVALQPVQTTMENNQELFGVKRQDFAPTTWSGEANTKADNKLFVENRIFQIEENNGTKTQLLAMDALDVLYLLDIHPRYATIVIRTGTGAFHLYRINVEKKTANLIPTEHQDVLNIRIWKAGHVVAALLMDQANGEESVVLYDLDTGEASTLMQSKDFPNRIDAKGDHLVLASEHVIEVKSTSGRLQEVANSLEPTLRYMRMTNDYLLYTDGVTDLNDTHAEYHGKTRVMKYDFHTGQSTNLLPGVEGEEWLLSDNEWGSADVDKYGVFVGNFVATEKVADDSGLPPVQMGLQQIWRVLPNGERTKVFEEKQRWDHHGLRMEPRNADRDLIEIQRTDNGMAPLFYNVKTGTVTMPQREVGG